MNERIASCHILAAVVAVDGHVNAAEEAFMSQIMSYLGLTTAEQAEVMSLQHGAEAAASLSDMSPTGRRELLDLAVAAVLVDGKLLPEEKAIVDHLSKLMGFQD